MRIVSNPVGSWSARGSWQTEPGNYVGIAIGPESDEARVYVDGQLLQAGRVLALRSYGSSFAIKRAVGPAQGWAIDLDQALQLKSVRRLDLMLFECPNELAAEVARPDGRYNTTAKTGDITGSPSGDNRVLTAAYTGRRQAQIAIFRSGPLGGGAATGTWGYKVYLRRWSDSQQAVKEKLIADSSGLTSADECFNIGGDNEAERGDEIAVDVFVDGAGTARFEADIITIGEIGAR